MLSYSPKLYARALYELASGKSETGLKQLAQHFFRTVERHGRSKDLKKILNILTDIDAEQNNTIEVVVRSASELDSETKQLIYRAVSKHIGDRIIKLKYMVEPGLLSGIKIEFDDTVLDMTAALWLKELENKIRNL